MTRATTIETLAPMEKGRALHPLEACAGAAPDDGRNVFDAVLRPNRSLPDQGFKAVMAVVIGANLTFGTYFLAIGAWPVLGFCGLDVFLVWLAFRLSYAQGRLRERVRVTPDELAISRILPSGHEMRWRLQPFWTRVQIDSPARHESQVRVTSKGGTLILGAFLSPEERVNFADALQDALRRARLSGRAQFG